jgi:cytidylate kinase
MSIEVLPHIFKEAERQLAELKTAKNAILTQTVRKAVQQIVPFIVSIFSNIRDYVNQRNTGLK